MSFVFIPTRFQWRLDTAANWTANNPTMLAGEPGLETDTGRFKLGDGTTAWSSLKYANLGAVDFTGLTDGDVPAWDATGSVFKMVAPSGGSGAMTLVGTATVTGSAATSLTLSGLDLASDQHYVIEYSLKNATSSVSTIDLNYNGDTTATHYYQNRLRAGVSAPSTATTNTAWISVLVGSATAGGNIHITPDLNGCPRALSQGWRDASASLEAEFYSHQWTTAANVTSITLKGSVASSLAIGSYIKVWKLT